MIFLFSAREHFLSQQFLNSIKQMHDHVLEKLMQQIYRHRLVNVDQTMISREIISIMNFHVTDLKNKILFLSFDLSLRSLMCSQESSTNQIFSRIWQHLIYRAISIKFHARDNHLLFVVTDKNRDDEKTSSSVVVDASHEHFVDKIFLNCYTQIKYLDSTSLLDCRILKTS